MRLNTTYSLISETHPRIIAFVFGAPVQPLRPFPVMPDRKPAKPFIQACEKIDALITDLADIPGIETIESSCHMIVITRAILSEWTGVIPAVLEAAKRGILRSQEGYTHVDLMFVDPEALKQWHEGCEQQAACWIAYGKGIEPQNEVTLGELLKEVLQ